MFRNRLLVGSAVVALTGLLSAPALAGDVAGTVVDSSNTAGLRAAEVVIEELGRRTVTSGDGTYVFNDVPEGTYLLQIWMRHVVRRAYRLGAVSAKNLGIE